jgi:hypothetical protein
MQKDEAVVCRAGLNRYGTGSLCDSPPTFVIISFIAALTARQSSMDENLYRQVLQSVQVAQAPGSSSLDRKHAFQVLCWLSVVASDGFA